MNPSERPLRGRHLNLSISGAGSDGSPGFPPAQVNKAMLQLVQGFVGQGLGVVFGHDWREDGVMESVHAYARQIAGPNLTGPEGRGVPVMMNFVPWPDKPSLSEKELDGLRGTLRVTTVGLPAGLRQFESDALGRAPDSPLFMYLRARGLTELRRALDRVSDARLCIGGPEFSAGRYPGIVEEAFLALQDGVPLYVSSLLGGVAAQLANAIRRQSMPPGFAQHTKPAGLYQEPPVPEFSGEDRKFDPIGVWDTFSRLGIGGLCGSNGLTYEENGELLSTQVIERVADLVLTGMARSKERSPGLGRAYSA